MVGEVMRGLVREYLRKYNGDAMRAREELVRLIESGDLEQSPHYWRACDEVRKGIPDAPDEVMQRIVKKLLIERMDEAMDEAQS